MQKIVNELISSSIKGVDVYRWKNATWLIFTDETRWVVELTDEGTLWYNYKFFKDVFKYISMDVGQQTEMYIIQWANDFFYRDCAHRTAAYPMDKSRNETPKVLDGGIKNVSRTRALGGEYIENIVENGIKEISSSDRDEPKPEFIEEVVNQGIKKVNQSDSIHRQRRAENEMNRMIKEVKPNRVTVHNEKMDRFYYDPACTANFTILTDIVEEGVKEAKPNVVFHGINKSSMSYVPCNGNTTEIGKVIEEGVKEIKSSIWTTKRGIDIHDLMCSGNTTDISSIVKSGVKNIYPDKDPDVYDWSDEFKADNVIQGGIKVIPLPDPSGELRGYSDYYNTKEDRTKPHTEYVKDAIDGGTKL
jgi:hypothetical protein